MVILMTIGIGLQGCYCMITPERLAMALERALEGETKSPRQVLAQWRAQHEKRQVDTEKEIRRLAAEGHSKTAVAEILGIGFYKMRDMCNAMDPPARWRGLGRYLENYRKGQMTDKHMDAVKRNCLIMNRRRKEQAAKTFRGFSGSIEEI